MAAAPAFARGPAAPATIPPGARLDFPAQPSRPQATAEGPAAADLEIAPPPRPRHAGLVLESTLGVLGFAGQFRHVAPPAYWIHMQLGYELAAWFMLFGEAELALTETSEAQNPSQERVFPMWGFGAGARASLSVTERLGAFVQVETGGLSAYVPRNALANLGFRGAESLGAQFGGRVGFEWYARDPHLGLSAQGGARYASGFSRLDSSGGLPLMWDASAGFRYAF